MQRGLGSRLVRGRGVSEGTFIVTRYWLNLDTLKHRFNDMEYGHARIDAENWLGEPLGWFETVERMNDYIAAQILPLLRKAWRSNPGLRLGQLIADASGTSDPFFVTDGELLQGLKELCDRY